MTVNAEDIRQYNTQADAEAVFALWQDTAGQEWPLRPERFHPTLVGPGAQHFVALKENQVVGFVGTMSGSAWGKQVGHLLVLLVAPAWQNKGIGTALHNTALAHFHSSGIHDVQLGGLTPRFWCGVPGNLPQAHDFFRSLGWTFETTVYDLTQPLRQYTSPPAVYQRIKNEQITLEPATAQEIDDILAFEGREFPNWLAHYERCAELGDYQDLLVARETSGQIVGTLIMYTSRSHPARPDLIWQELVGADAGAMGAVGVAASERGRGIGIALVARASDILKMRGVGFCQIDWVELTDFYAKLGYTKWRSYKMSWRKI